MIRSALVSTMALALSLATAPAGFAAAPPNTSVATPVVAAQAKPAKIKQIGFDVRNDSTTPLTLQAGAEQISVKPGETRHLRIGTGTVLTNVVATPHYAAGLMVTTVTSALSGTTLVLS